MSTIKQNNVVHNVEVKAYVDNYEQLCDRVAALATAAPEDRVQNDVFYNCQSGRLKLRSSGKYHDLIFYRRVNDYGPTESFYQYARTQNPMALRTSLNSAFGEMGRVKKFRRSFKLGHSTVHLDRVAGLGEFLEIKTKVFSNHTNNQETTGVNTVLPETVAFKGGARNLEADNDAGCVSTSEGSRIVEDLMSALDVDLFQLVDGAYIDLIIERS